MFTQALLALIGLYGGAWLLFRSKNQELPRRVLLASLTNFAVAAYLLCDIGLLQAADTALLVKFEKASTGLAIIALGLVPWILQPKKDPASQLPAIAHSALAVLLGIANALAPVSLRFDSLLKSSTSPQLIQSTPSLWNVPFLLLAFLASGFLLRHAARTRHADSPRLALLFAATSLAISVFPLLESQQGRDSSPAQNLVWIALALLATAASASQFQTATGQQTRQPDATSPKEATEDAAPPIQERALLLDLESHDETLAAKLLASQGYTVAAHDDPSQIPPAYFKPAHSRHSVLFRRTSEDHLPPAIEQLAQQADQNVSLIALSEFPKSPRILREIRDGKYHRCLKTPLVAKELLQAATSHTLNDFPWTQPHHTH